ncbi:MAG: GNAT family N-acetyltransferase [Oscillospiraceae bacterium]|nr:GNAT family N-acetyltransferase [Oscillospiraceae bacterium]
MLELQKLSDHYQVRRMQDTDADAILALCLQNTQYYQYCGKQPSRELILNDLHITPPGIGPSDKYYTGFYSETDLAAVLDLIDGYPDQNACWIGFFMMNKRLQGRQLGTEIIQHLCRYLREAGYTMLRLGIDKDNPQSTHFWKKNGFRVVREVKQDEGTILVAEKAL